MPLLGFTKLKEDLTKVQAYRQKTYQRISCAWQVSGKRVPRELYRKVENYAYDVLLPRMGFQEIIWFTKYPRGNHKETFRNFAYDFYATKGAEHWFIEVTCGIRKRLDRPLTKVLRKIGCHVGVLFVRRDLGSYVFKDLTNVDVEDVTLNIGDVGLLRAQKGA